MAEFEVSGKKFVVIGKDEYDALVEADNFLMCLQALGVDNWEGHEGAIRMNEGEISEDDI